MELVYNEEKKVFEESKAVPVYFESSADALKVINLLTGGFLDYHDVRKDPEDLPRPEEKVICCTETKTGSRNYVLGYHMGERWVCGMNNNVISWIRMIPFEG